MVIDLLLPRRVPLDMPRRPGTTFDCPDEDQPVAHGKLVMCKPDSLLHHWERGYQYTIGQSRRLMADNWAIYATRGSDNVWNDPARNSSSTR